jgi:[ribosomal protein S5]-alanine N-acetyltransferase
LETDLTALCSVTDLSTEYIKYIVDYWNSSDPAYLVSMGVDLKKLPAAADLEKMLSNQVSLSHPYKSSYCIIWLLENTPVGHSNINPISFGNEAYMHLHLWKVTSRNRGLGSIFIKKTLPFFFSSYQLKKIVSEPYALNPAPNRTLAKSGFTFTGTYTTIPGSINFEQPVNRWELSFENYRLL